MPTGTVAVTNGNATVTGTGTSFIADPGDLLVVNGTSAVILTRNSATSITLETVWPGTTAGAATNWGIARLGTAARQTVTVNNKVSSLLDLIAPTAGGSFTNNVTMTVAGNALFSIFGSAAAFVRMADTGAAANSRYHDIVADGGNIIF